MNDVKWIKLSVGMLDNRKIKRVRRLPDGNNIILIWVFLLLKAAESNEDGGLFFLEDMPYTVDDLADEFGFSVDLIQFAIKTLEKLKMIETYDEVIYIKNWEKYQNVDGLDKIREQTRKRVAKHRDKKTIEQPVKECNVTSNGDVTQGNATELELELELDIDIDKEYIHNIFYFWNEQEIIKHRKMNQTMRSHINARLQEYSFDELKQAIANYNDILISSDYYWTHKWSLQDFMKPNNVNRFVDEANPKNNFKSSKNSKSSKDIDWGAL